jgi:putative hemolysin
MTKNAASIALVIVLVLLFLTGMVALIAWQDGSCADKGGKRVTTSGFNYICVAPDGRIIP